MRGKSMPRTKGECLKADVREDLLGAGETLRGRSSIGIRQGNGYLEGEHPL